MIPTRGPQNHIPLQVGGRDMETPQSGADVGRG